ncbi:MAG: leucyl aminopeptidase [Acidobacteriota bacterium]
MKISGVPAAWPDFACDALILPLAEDSLKREEGPLAPLLERLRTSGEWKGEAGEVLVLYGCEAVAADRLILLGLGKREDLDPDRTRTSVLKALRRLKGCRLQRLAAVSANLPDEARFVMMAVDGAVMSLFDPGVYKSSDSRVAEIGELVFLLSDRADLRRFPALYEKAQVYGEAVNLARRLTHEPGNRMTPEVFAEEARQAAESVGLEVTVLDERAIREAGLAAVLAVASGSEHPPRFVVIEHRGRKGREKPICLVGKGVTFDAGGISLKPAQSMEEMKSDKAGACAVLGAMLAVARLGLPRPAVGVIPVVENLPGGRAQRPGDVIRCHGGKTVEVINTDAEGRLILADAMSWAKERYSPSEIVDIATLTGACIIALGHVRAGYFSNDEKLVRRFVDAAGRSYEKFWRLPLDPEYREDLKSDIADLRNVGQKWGGAITAAKFLEEFVGDTPWVHIDMAGVDLFQGDQKAEGPRGFGVRTLAELVAGD